MCVHRTKRLSCKFSSYKPNCMECDKSPASLEYQHADLYNQMRYFKYLFDVDTYTNIYKADINVINANLNSNQDMTNALKDLRDFIATRIKKNTYGVVNFKSIFSCLTELKL